MTHGNGASIALILVMSVSRALGAGVLYHVTRLGYLSPHGLSNTPAVTGSLYEGDGQAFLWTPQGGMLRLGEGPYGFGSYGYAVSNLAHITGDVNLGGTDFGAFLWTPDDGMIMIGDLPGGSTSGNGLGINDLDQVVGYGSSANGQEAFIWDRVHGIRPLGDLPGGQFLSTATDINNSGQVTGSSVSDVGDQAFIWTEQGGFEVLIPPGPNIYPFDGEAINELGQVTGMGYGPRGVEGFFWDPVQGSIGTGRFEGGSPAVWPEDLNDLGQVVGTARTCSTCAVQGFIWDRVNGIRRLTELLDASAVSPYHEVKSAQGINNAGQIVAIMPGGSALLTPFVLADMNCDGSVNQFDVQGFVLTLSGDEARYAETYPNCHGDWAADTNQDGSINLFDIQAFVDLLGGG